MQGIDAQLPHNGGRYFARNFRDGNTSVQQMTER
jgi:hypothetical protein